MTASLSVMCLMFLSHGFFADDDITASNEIDWSCTSWQDPFRKAFWNSRGWTFDKDSMQSGVNAEFSAQFKRGYRKLTLSFEIEPLGGRSPSSFVVRLDAPKQESTVTIELKSDRVVVSEVRDKKRRIIRQKKMTVELRKGKPLRLAVAATGNRLILILNGRRFLVCNQPAHQSGRDLHFSLVTRKSKFRVRKLRIEGE